MRRLLVLALGVLVGCGPGVCGTAEFALVYGDGGDAGLLYDRDGDNTADLIEECGTLWGSFGFRRTDLPKPLTWLIFQPGAYGNNFERELEISTYLLPASSVAFITDHLVEGAVLGMGELGGSGLHKLGGTAGETYAVYGMLDAELTVVEGPRKVRGTFAEEDEAEDWRLRWRITFGDTQNQMPLQTWDAEDWIQISRGTTGGTPTDLPPDW